MGNNHICVCICTYKREHLLERLLIKLFSQKTDGLFTYSVLVVDNDCEFSAKKLVNKISKNSQMSIEYLPEPVRSIPLARNRAVRNASGDLLAFIDDDEFPADDWLLNLYEAFNRFRADGILGPVHPHLE